MNSLTLSGKIKSLFIRKGKKKSRTSALSRKFEQHNYKAKHQGATARKKSIREKLLAKREEHRRQRVLPIPGRDSVKQRSPFKLLLLAGLIFSGGFFLLLGPVQTFFGDLQYFRIHEIEISGCVVTNPKALRKFANISYAVNMLTIDPKDMQERLENHPWVRQAEVRRIWPDGLNVSIREHRPQALVVQNDGNGFSYFDNKGTIFTEVVPGQDLDFPVITGLGAFETELEKEKFLDAATSFLRLAGRNNPNLPAQNVSEIHFDGDGELILYLVDHPFPIYFGKGDIKRKYYQLRKVLEVLYRKKNGKVMIENVAYIRMDYQENKVLVAQGHAG
jgi:cell division protein FtsQ